MPVLTVDAGRSDAGRRAAASHTAAAATPTMTRQALFTQAGITATRTVGELLETAALMHAQPLPAGTRVAVVSNAGGAAVLAADTCAEAGLTVPELPAELIDELLGMLPEGATAANPVDATAAVGEHALSDCVDRLAAHGAVDAVLVALVPTALASATGDDPQRALTHAGPGGAPVPSPRSCWTRPSRYRCCTAGTGRPSPPTPTRRPPPAPWPTPPHGLPGSHDRQESRPSSPAPNRPGPARSWPTSSPHTPTAAGSTRCAAPNCSPTTASRRSPPRLA